MINKGKVYTYEMNDGKNNREMENKIKEVERVFRENVSGYPLAMIKYKDFICELMEEYATQQSKGVSEWISVKDRLPKENKIYLIVHYNSTDEAHFRDGKWYSTDRPNVNENAFVKTYSRTKLNDVTHWQPLPQPPKQLTKKD